jgi:hypothetical protein
MKYLQMSESVVQQAVGNITMLMDAKQGRYLELNETGAVILQALLTGATQESIAQQLSNTYQVSLAQALDDVSKLTSELLAAKLLELAH